MAASRRGEDGSEWTKYTPIDLTYDGKYASFTATSFSGYAMSAVPEPGTLALLAGGVAALLVYARRKSLRLRGPTRIAAAAWHASGLSVLMRPSLQADRVVRRSVCLGLCVLLGFALAANAEVVNVTMTRTAYDASLDQVILRMQPISGTDVPAGDYLVGLWGSWTMGTGTINLPGTSANWVGKVLNDANAQDSDGGVAGVGPTTPQSWINFGTMQGEARSRDGLVSGTLYHGFTLAAQLTGAAHLAFGVGPVDLTPGGTVDDGNGYGFDNTILAVFYVTTATPTVVGQVLFTGFGCYALPTGGDATQQEIPTTVQIVPEPSTTVLLLCGLAAVMARARRRRR